MSSVATALLLHQTTFTKCVIIRSKNFFNIPRFKNSHVKLRSAVYRQHKVKQHTGNFTTIKKSKACPEANLSDLHS